MLASIETRFAAVAPAVDFCSLRFVRERSEGIQSEAVSLTASRK